MSEMKFRRTPEPIEAMQWDGTAEGATAIIDWVLTNDGLARYSCVDPDHCVEHNGNSPHYITVRAEPDDSMCGLHCWVVMNDRNEFQVYAPDDFDRTYEWTSDGV